MLNQDGLRPVRNNINMSNDAESGSNIPRVIFIMLALVFLVVIGFIANKYLLREENNPDLVALIVADKEPFKIEPSEPGGIEIPFMENTVYDNISGSQAKRAPERERILPPPEEPINREKLLGKEEQVTVTSEVAIEEPKSDELGQLIEKSLQAQPSKAVMKDVEASESLVKNKDRIVKGLKIQLGTLFSKEDADREALRLKKKFAQDVGSYDFLISKQDLGDKGIVWRLQIGMIKNENDAKILCKKLKEQNQGCLIVKQ